MSGPIEGKPPSVGKYLTGGDILHGKERPPQMGFEANDFAEEPEEKEGDDWLRRAREAYDISTNYLDANYRKRWEDSIRAFNSQHPNDSKYNSPNYSKRSNIFRPKTRAAIRKNEAAAAQAFFSNLDVVSVEAMNSGDKAQIISASVMKELMQYRLTKTIPWFQLLLGGVQDAQTVGVVCSHQYWEYKEVDGKAIVDRPCVKLLPIENIRIDPGADWLDPIQTSPYLIELMPMYVGDIKVMMETTNPKTGQAKWKKQSDGVIRSAMQDRPDSTRITRQKDREDPYEPDGRGISEYEIVWVQKHIHRKGNQDWIFYCLADVAMLTDPVPLEEEYAHGERPYAMGCAIIETHKVFPSGLPEITAALQTEANEIANQRLDNVKFVLNKKWFVKRGKNVDIPAIVRNVPGGVVLMENVGADGDVQEVNWPDVTKSSFEEQDRLNADFNDLAGSPSPAEAQLTRKGNEPGRVMQLMAQSGTPMVEYTLRTITETWIEKVLRQLMKLEQAYETDQVIIALAASKAKIFQKYGINQVTDDLLNQELTLRVNVGMGATDPQTKIQKLMGVVGAVGQLLQQPPPGMNVTEVSKELFGFAGYQDGTRFMSSDDPEKDMLKQQIEHGKQIIQELTKRIEEGLDKEKLDIASKEKIAHEANQVKLALADKQQKGDPKAENERATKEMEQKHQREVAKIMFDADVKVKKMVADIEIAGKKLIADTEIKKGQSEHKQQQEKEKETSKAKEETKAKDSGMEEVKKALELQVKGLDAVAKALEAIAKEEKKEEKPKTLTVTSPTGQKYTAKVS